MKQGVNCSRPEPGFVGGREVSIVDIPYHRKSEMMPLSCLWHGDGVADAAEDVVAAVAAAGGDDEVVFAAGDWVVEDSLIRFSGRGGLLTGVSRTCNRRQFN